LGYDWAVSGLRWWPALGRALQIFYVTLLGGGRVLLAEVEAGVVPGNFCVDSLFRLTRVFVDFVVFFPRLRKLTIN